MACILISVTPCKFLNDTKGCQTKNQNKFDFQCSRIPYSSSKWVFIPLFYCIEKSNFFSLNFKNTISKSVLASDPTIIILNHNIFQISQGPSGNTKSYWSHKFGNSCERVRKEWPPRSVNEKDNTNGSWYIYTNSFSNNHSAWYTKIHLHS